MHTAPCVTTADHSVFLSCLLNTLSWSRILRFFVSPRSAAQLFLARGRHAQHSFAIFPSAPHMLTNIETFLPFLCFFLLSRLQGHCCADIMCSLLCTPCVACQLLAETKIRGGLHDDWGTNPTRPRFEQPWKFGLLKCTDDLTTCENTLLHCGLCVELRL